MTDDIAHVSRLIAAGSMEAASDRTRAAIRAGGDLLPWLKCALQVRESGNPGGARLILSAMIAERPGLPMAVYELAFLHRLEGDHRGAAAMLASALPHDPRSVRLRLFLAHMLHACGAHAEADATLTPAVARDAAERNQLDVMHGFGRYLEQNPLGRALVLHDRLIAQNAWVTHDAIADDIERAVAQRRPYALIRMGDGEGGVLRLNALDEALYRPLYDQNRQELIAMWFGHAFPWRTNGFFELAAKLVESTGECDVIGIPYESWIRHEYKISSLRGVSSLVNVIHAFLAQSGPRRRFASQLVHVELARSGRLASIIAGARRVSVISCLDVLPAALKRKFDLEQVTFYRIPGEQGSRHILGEATTRGTHFPDRYEQLQAELSKPHDGQLFLIAGGLLGKLYAATIRRFGGVAIDIGSVVDTWAGHSTRPGYNKDEALV